MCINLIYIHPGMYRRWSQYIQSKSSSFSASCNPFGVTISLMLQVWFSLVYILKKYMKWLRMIKWKWFWRTIYEILRLWSVGWMAFRMHLKIFRYIWRLYIQSKSSFILQPLCGNHLLNAPSLLEFFWKVYEVNVSSGNYWVLTKWKRFRRYLRNFATEVRRTWDACEVYIWRLCGPVIANVDENLENILSE